MKNFLEKILTLLFSVTLFSSCSPLKVTFSPKGPGKIDKIALVSTYLSIQLPVLPLLDAAVMNGKTNSISTEINDLLKENIDGMRENAANLLKTNLRCDVIYGETLHTTPGYKELKGLINIEDALFTGKDNFPVIFAAKDDINPFDFKKGRVDRYFQDPDNYVNSIERICKGLNVDYVAVSHSVILPVPGAILRPATLYMYTYFYLFDKQGKVMASGRNCAMPPVSYKPNEIDGYERVLDTHSSALGPIIEKVSARYGN